MSIKTNTIDPPIFMDTETTGLHGILVLLQHAVGDGPVELWHIWHHTASENIEFLTKLVNHEGGIVVFNGTFESFHINKFLNICLLLVKKHGENNLKMKNRQAEVLDVEADARFGVCVKFKAMSDLMLVCRQVKEYQCSMKREGIRIRKVPSIIATELQSLLNHKVKVDPLMFGKANEPDKQWGIYDVPDEEGNIDPFLKDVAMVYKCDGGLKAIAHTMGIARAERSKFLELELKPHLTKEKGFAPFAKAWMREDGSYERKCWPEVLDIHIDYWYTSAVGQKYAKDDVFETRDMYYKLINTTDFDGKMNDTNSILAGMVGAVRWKGFDVNVAGIQELKNHCQKIIDYSEVNFRSTDATLEYLLEVLTENEQEALVDAFKGQLCTKSKNLEDIAKSLHEMESCPECYGLDIKNCKICNDKGEVIEYVKSCRRCETGFFDDEKQKPENNGCCDLCVLGKPKEGALRAQEIIDFRVNCKEVELYDKIIRAERFHAGFSIIGALSGRMSGSDDLNAMGIKNAQHVRKCFTLGNSLGGGDFDAFEVAIMDAVYADEKLNEELQKGKKIHAIFGTFIYPDTVTVCSEDFYNEIKAEYDTAIKNGRQPKIALVEFLETYKIGDKMEGYWAIMADKKKYKQSKSGLLGTLYGGDDNTLVNRLGVDNDVAKKCFHDFCDSYQTWGACRKDMSDSYSLIDDKFNLKSYKEYAETMYGFRRYFNQEYSVIEKLFSLAKNPPSHWAEYQAGEVIRSPRKGPQTVGKATVSALFGAVMSTQSAIFRAAVNHCIQGSGAQITKELQATIWEMQPAGVHEWNVQPLQVHDEVLCVSKPELALEVKKRVDKHVDYVKERIPLTGMKWQYDLKSWQEKE